MNKLSLNYQRQFEERLIFDKSIFKSIDPRAKLHNQIKGNPLSSAASCLNVIGSLANRPDNLMKYLNSFGLEIETVFEFPSGADIEGLVYNDRGYVIFEWIGPQFSPICEKGGGRGLNRTSIDAFLITRIRGKITQLFIEWKFTEGISRPLVLNRFAGNTGLERLRRYSTVLASWRKTDKFPFKFKEKDGFGLYDFSADHLYQLLRMTLLARSTIGIIIGEYEIEDYRIVHLSHSMNDEIDILHGKYLSNSPGLLRYSGMKFHDAWKDILTASEKKRFIGGHWDTALNLIKDEELRDYLIERYG
jgi:hypothetical protein